MKLYIFCVRDRAVADYGPPMFLMSRGHAIRHFGDQINRAEKDNPLFAHPEDYDLFLLGEYETSSGTFVVHDPEQIAIGKDLAQKSN